MAEPWLRKLATQLQIIKSISYTYITYLSKLYSIFKKLTENILSTKIVKTLYKGCHYAGNMPLPLSLLVVHNTPDGVWLRKIATQLQTIKYILYHTLANTIWKHFYLYLGTILVVELNSYLQLLLEESK